MPIWRTAKGESRKCLMESMRLSFLSFVPTFASLLQTQPARIWLNMGYHLFRSSLCEWCVRPLLYTSSTSSTQHAVPRRRCSGGRGIVWEWLTRQVITVPITLAYLLFGPPHLSLGDIQSQISPRTADGRLIWSRSLIMVCVVSTTYFALSQIEVSAFIAIFHLRPFPTAFLCYLVLKEPFGKVQTISCGTSFPTLSSRCPPHLKH